MGERNLRQIAAELESLSIFAAQRSRLDAEPEDVPGPWASVSNLAFELFEELTDHIGDDA